MTAKVIVGCNAKHFGNTPHRDRGRDVHCQPPPGQIRKLRRMHHLRARRSWPNSKQCLQAGNTNGSKRIDPKFSGFIGRSSSPVSATCAGSRHLTPTTTPIFLPRTNSKCIENASETDASDKVDADMDAANESDDLFRKVIRFRMGFRQRLNSRTLLSESFAVFSVMRTDPLQAIECTTKSIPVLAFANLCP